MFKLKTGMVDCLDVETKTGKVDDPCVGTSKLKDEMLPTRNLNLLQVKAWWLHFADFSSGG